MKPNFERCANLATDLLYKQQIDTTKIDVKKLKYDKNIIIDSIQGYVEATNSNINGFMGNNVLKGGCCIYDKCSDTYIVLYNADIKNKEHINWTLAHEIGHIYLGHTKDGDIEEVEAHQFAAQLLMPEHSLNYIKNLKKVLTEEQICNIFFVSHAAARKRIKHMEKKKYIRSSSKDRAILNRTKTIIDLKLMGPRYAYLELIK